MIFIASLFVVCFNILTISFTLLFLEKMVNNFLEVYFSIMKINIVELSYILNIRLSLLASFLVAK